MAAITINAAHRTEQARKQLETALAAYREMLDRFVSNQMRQAAAEAEQARPRQIPGLPAKNVK
jgi:xanthine dehydrogenase iron-sulfur cluster and FAD-binding subunit A